jgi:catechol 2,3-dioxygenase-like lactoylglutathione lyase family enzyme
MKSSSPAVFIFLALSACLGLAPEQTISRPKILGVGSVHLTSSSVKRDAIGFYVRSLGFGGGRSVCEGALELCLEVNAGQRLDLDAPKVAGAQGELAEIYFLTSDASGMRRYLVAAGVQASELASTPAARAFRVRDPDGHRIGFIQYTRSDQFTRPDNQVSSRLIHAGFIVRNRGATEHFYKDLLGFRPYWQGGMKDDQVDWVSLQVPDGTDWVEFMVNVPETADQRLRGIMNHIALGVRDIQAAREQLVRNGAHLTEEPKLGRDGKWQLNLYDPDQTRIEFMEFAPKEKPCCSEFTGPHPQP